ncbi:hypothetical protein [Actinomadura luteofluorescens]|uniref:hypothetical protein n=1 Tax=Actinomadura luteofluorescens TaxID=46163 RepID=UPI003D921175
MAPDRATDGRPGRAGGAVRSAHPGLIWHNHCRAAYAAYRAERRAQGKDSPRKPRVIDDDPHISANCFRTRCWHPPEPPPTSDGHPASTTSATPTPPGF